jgi:hypothetical protein
LNGLMKLKSVKHVRNQPLAGSQEGL